MLINFRPKTMVLHSETCLMSVHIHILFQELKKAVASPTALNKSSIY